MLATGNETGNVGHVDHEIGANRIGDLAEALPVPGAGIGGATSDDQLRLMLSRERTYLIWINQTVSRSHAVCYHLVVLS